MSGACNAEWALSQPTRATKGPVVPNTNTVLHMADTYTDRTADERAGDIFADPIVKSDMGFCKKFYDAQPLMEETIGDGP